MKELNIIIQDLKETIKSEKIGVTENCLFENAIKILISNNINNSKRELKDNNLNNEKQIENQLVTEKQKYFLKKNKIRFDNNLTKLEAMKLIEEIKR